MKRFLVALALCGCGSATPTAKDQQTVAEFQAELMLCISENGNNNAAVDCMCTVARRYKKQEDVLCKCVKLSN